MGGRLFVTDSKEVSKAIQRVSETRWDGINGKSCYLEAKVKEKNPTMRILELKPEKIIDGSFMEEYRNILDEEMRDNKTLINAFSPTERGNLLYELFLQHSGIEDQGDLCRKRYAAEPIRQIFPINNAERKRDAEVMKLELWAKRTINAEITRQLRSLGLYADYDLLLIPVYAELERRRLKITNFVPDHITGLLSNCAVKNSNLSMCLCDQNGKKLTGTQDLFNRFKDTVIQGKVIQEKRSTRQITPPLLYDFLSLVQDLEFSNFYFSDIRECLDTFYMNGFINYPYSGERKINQTVQEQMASKEEILALYGRKEEWNPIVYGLPCEKKETAGGIMVLHHAGLPELFQTDTSIEKQIIERLLRRQIAITSQPAKVETVSVLVKAGEYYFTGEREFLVHGGWRTEAYDESEQKSETYLDAPVCLSDFALEYQVQPKLYTAAGLITFLRIHGITNDTIVEVLSTLGKGANSYANNYKGQYIVRQADRKTMKQLPECLLSLNLATELLADLQRVKSERLSPDQFMERVRQRISEIEKEIQKGATENEK